MTSLEQLARDRLARVAEKEAIEDKIKDIDAQIIDAVEAGGIVEIDGQPVYRVQQNRPFNVDLARKVLPAEMIAACTVTVEQIDKERLDALATGMGLREQCLKPGAPHVRPVTGGRP